MLVYHNPILHIFFVLIACVLFLLAGLGVPQSPRFQFIGWGLFLLTLAFCIVIN